VVGRTSIFKLQVARAVDALELAFLHRRGSGERECAEQLLGPIGLAFIVCARRGPYN